MTTTSITSGQLKQITRFTEDATAKGLEAALAKVSPDQEGMQRVIENGDEYTARIENAIEMTLRELSINSQYANEEVRSNYGYPDGYRVKGVNEQGNILRQLFPGIGMNDESLTQQPLPAGAEGYFVFPRWELVAPTYGQALEIALELLKKQRKGQLKNCDESKTMPVPWIDIYYANENIKNYREVMKWVCQEQKVLFLDLEQLGDEDFDDGLHPNAAGHQKIFIQAKDFLKLHGWI